jgi:IS30 family transposase
LKDIHRNTIAAYVSVERHLRGDGRGAKTLTQMAKEIGTTKSTVGRWLRRDHWALWMEFWASAEEIWEAAQRDRQRLPQRDRQLAEEQCRTALLAHLDGCFADLASGGQLQFIE